jgi:hypothetical protein
MVGEGGTLFPELFVTEMQSGDSGEELGVTMAGILRN